MAESSLITIANVQSFRKISTLKEQVRFDAFVNDVQKINLRDLLGAPLYFAFMNDARTTGIYNVLLEGENYTFAGEIIKYYGLRPFVIYHYLAKMTREGNLFHTNYGTVEFTNNPQQNFVPSKLIQEVAKEYLESAVTFGNEVIQYLNEKSSTYPLWEGNKQQNKTDFTFISV